MNWIAGYFFRNGFQHSGNPTFHHSKKKSPMRGSGGGMKNAKAKDEGVFSKVTRAAMFLTDSSLANAKAAFILAKSIPTIGLSPFSSAFFLFHFRRIPIDASGEIKLTPDQST